MAISEVIMQLIVRGEQTHVLDVAPTANVEALRAQLSLLEVSYCHYAMFSAKMRAEGNLNYSDCFLGS